MRLTQIKELYLLLLTTNQNYRRYQIWWWGSIKRRVSYLIEVINWDKNEDPINDPEPRLIEKNWREHNE